jgi:carbon-monoxide dehydrogenase medium subunit
MYDVQYHKASSIDDAVQKVGSSEDGMFLSGGQTLIPTMKQRLASPSDIVDVARIDAMRGVSVSPIDEGGVIKKLVSTFTGAPNAMRVTIGAATTHADVASSSELQTHCKGLADLAGNIGDPHVRNRGTIGGSVANNDPAADYPAAMMALDADIETNKRTIAASDFFKGMFETALEDDEMIKSISFTTPEKAAYSKFPNPASRYAMAGVFVANGENGPRVAVTGAGSDGVFRHTEMEQKLSTNWSSASIETCAVDTSKMLSDIHGDGEYRANLVKVMAKRSIDAA